MIKSNEYVLTKNEKVENGRFIRRITIEKTVKERITTSKSVTNSIDINRKIVFFLEKPLDNKIFSFFFNI